jgi:hypothetical protein
MSKDGLIPLFFSKLILWYTKTNFDDQVDYCYTVAAFTPISKISRNVVLELYSLLYNGLYNCMDFEINSLV